MKIGQKIYGYCDGMFGRDFYGPARIEAVGIDWVVVRDKHGEPYFGYGKTWESNLQDSQNRLNEWDKDDE